MPHIEARDICISHSLIAGYPQGGKGINSQAFLGKAAPTGRGKFLEKDISVSPKKPIPPEAEDVYA